MKVKVSVPRESIKRHDIRKTGETPGSALFNIRGDGFDYQNVPFGPDLYKILRKELPAMAARKGEDIEWDPDVVRAAKVNNAPGSNYKASGQMDKEALEATLERILDKTQRGEDLDEFEKNFDPRDFNFTEEELVSDNYKAPDVGSDYAKNVMQKYEGTGTQLEKHLRGAKPEEKIGGWSGLLLDALKSGDFTKMFEPLVTLKNMYKEHKDDRTKHTGYPAYDFSQWEEDNGNVTVPKVDKQYHVVMQYDPDSYENQIIRGRKLYTNPKDVFAAKMLKNAKDDPLQYDSKDASAKIKQATAGKESAGADNSLGQATRTAYKSAVKWIAKELGVPKEEVAANFQKPLFEAMYTYDEGERKGWWDRDQVVQVYKDIMATKKKDAEERQKNIANTLDGIM